MTNFYLDQVSGSDANSGLSMSLPLKTIAELLTKPIEDGDSIYLKRGSLWRESLKLNTKNSITVKAYGIGSAPVLDASDIYSAVDWTAYTTGGLTKVWSMPLVITLNSDLQLSVWDNNRDSPIKNLRKATSIAGCNSTVGSFYHAGGVLYVSTYAGTAPVNNQISVSVRDEALFLGSNALVEDITTRRNLRNDGSLVVGRNSIVRRSSILDGSKHNMLIGSGIVEDCDLSGQCHPGDIGGASSAIGGFFIGTGTEKLTVRRCKGNYLHASSLIANCTFTTAHASGGGEFSEVEIDNCWLYNYGGIFGHNPTQKITITNNRFFDCRAVISGGLPEVNSANNDFVRTPDSSWTYLMPVELFTSATKLTSLNDTFNGNPNTGQGFITLREAASGSVIDIKNPAFTCTGNLLNTALIHWSCTGTLKMTGARTSGGVTGNSPFAIWGHAGMSYQLSGNQYRFGQFFNVDGGYKNLSAWQSFTGQDLDAATYLIPGSVKEPGPTGDFTPSYTNVANAANPGAVVPYKAIWDRNDDVMHLSGAIKIDPDVINTETIFDITLPPLPPLPVGQVYGFTNSNQLYGFGVSSGVSGTTDRILIYANTNNGKAQVYSIPVTTAGAQTYYYQLKFQIIVLES